MPNEIYEDDLKRYGGQASFYIKRLLYWFRKAQCSRGIVNMFSRAMFQFYAQKHGLEFSTHNKIGNGLYIGHPYNITLNADVIIGHNCNIHKGVVIGQENRGIKKGTPVIGNKVWIGINSAIVGKIQIGSDVLIAPNSYVNCDVPDHSIVFGNPCIIKHCDDATKEYINNVC